VRQEQDLAAAERGALPADVATAGRTEPATSTR
jgi:hypothetical protein